MTERSFEDKVREHFENAPIVQARPDAKGWPDGSFFQVQSFDEVHELFRVARKFITIPPDTAKHELQHVDAIGMIGNARGGESIGVRMGIAVVRHPQEGGDLKRYSALAATIPNNGELSDLEYAAVLGYPDKPSNFDVQVLRDMGFRSVAELGKAVLRHNTEHDAPLLPLPRSYSEAS